MTVSFEGYAPFHPMHIVPSQSPSRIPPHTLLTGKVKMLWAIGTSAKLSLGLLCHIDPLPSTTAYQAPASVSANDNSKMSRQMLRLDLAPSRPIPKGRELEFTEMLGKERDRLRLNSVVQLDVGGMAFLGYEEDGTTRRAILRGEGSRLVGLAGGEVRMLELDLPPPSKTPSWLPPPSPAPLSPSKLQTSTCVHPNITATEITTTRLRPVSAFQNQFTIPSSDRKEKRLSNSEREPADAGDAVIKRRKISTDNTLANGTIHSVSANVVTLGPPIDSHLGQGANPDLPPVRASFLPESGSTIESIQGSTHPSPARVERQGNLAELTTGGIGDAKLKESAGMKGEEVLSVKQVSRWPDAEDLDMEAAIREAEEYVESQLEPGHDGIEMEEVQLESVRSIEAEDPAKTPSSRPIQPDGPTALPAVSRPNALTSQNPITPAHTSATPGPGPNTSRQTIRRQAELTAIAKAQSAHAEAEKTALADRISLEALNRDLILPRQLPPDARSEDGRRVSGTKVYLDPIALGGIEYTTIGNMRSKVHGCTGIIGVVLDISGYKQTSKGDWICTIIVTDPSVHAENANSNEDFLVTVFRKAKEQLPVIPTGTPILFRGVRVTEFNSKPKGQAYSNDLNTYATLVDGKVTYESLDKMKPPLSREEVERLAGMGKWWREKMGGDVGGQGSSGGTGGSRVSLGATGRGKRPLLTLGDIRDGMFCDVAFKILHVAPNSRGTPALELYITDGTPSPYPLRNFHNITHPQIPLSCIYQMAIHSKPSADEMGLYESGNVVMMRNVRPKVYKGELELSWSELVTDFQAKEGWNRRRVSKVGKEEEKAKEIERRLAALRKGEDPIAPAVNNPSPAKAITTKSVTQATSGPALVPSTSNPVPVLAPTTAPAPTLDIPESRTLKPAYTDPIRHPFTPLSEIDQNQTVPNRFKVRARVERICSVGKKGGSWVLKWCMHCSRSFDTPFCQSCNDATLINAEYRYRFLLVLSPHPPSTISLTLPVLVGDAEALSFLPPLPPLKSTGNPNDQRAMHNRLNEIYRRVEETLMGNNVDGAREKPITEFCVESYLARPRKGKGKEMGQGVKVFRLFGMKGAE